MAKQPPSKCPLYLSLKGKGCGLSGEQVQRIYEFCRDTLWGMPFGRLADQIGGLASNHEVVRFCAHCIDYLAKCAGTSYVNRSALFLAIRDRAILFHDQYAYVVAQRVKEQKTDGDQRSRLIAEIDLLREELGRD